MSPYDSVGNGSDKLAYSGSMTEPRSQQLYQLRLAWAEHAYETLAESEIVIVIDAIETDDAAAALAAHAAALPHQPSVFLASLRNAAATADAVVAEQLERGTRTSINLVLCGDQGQFAVEDYLAAGAIADRLSARGIDHSSPEVAVAVEGFRPLTRALKHLFSASGAGAVLSRLGRANEVLAAARVDSIDHAVRYSV